MVYEIKFGIFGCVNIVCCFVRFMKLFFEVKIYVIVSRILVKVQSFVVENEFFEEIKVYGSYDEFVEDEEVDVLYIFFFIVFYVEWVFKVVVKKKYVLFEKLLVCIVEEFKVMVEVFDKNGLQYMDGIMWMYYFCMWKMEVVFYDFF